MPEHFKSRPLSRYQQYIESPRASPKNDFATLLDEFVAYVGAAALESAIVRSADHTVLLPSDVTSYDGNLGGVVDFMLFALCYLQTLRTEYPEAYATVKSQPGTMLALGNTWREAEHVLKESYAQTTIGGKGGRFALPPDVLSAAYSDEFLAELDLLGIDHLPSTAWNSTYFRDAK